VLPVTVATLSFTAGQAWCGSVAGSGTGHQRFPGACSFVALTAPT